MNLIAGTSLHRIRLVHLSGHVFILTCISYFPAVLEIVKLFTIVFYISVWQVKNEDYSDEDEIPWGQRIKMDTSTDRKDVKASHTLTCLCFLTTHEMIQNTLVNAI